MIKPVCVKVIHLTVYIVQLYALDTENMMIVGYFVYIIGWYRVFGVCTTTL